MTNSTFANQETNPVTVSKLDAALNPNIIKSLSALPHDDHKKDILRNLRRAPQEIKVDALYEFFRLLYEPYLDTDGNSDKFVQIDFKDVNGKFKTLYYRLSKEKFPKIAKELFTKGMVDCAYFGICPRDEVRRFDDSDYEVGSQNSDISEAAFLWVDIDGKQFNPDDIPTAKREILDLIKGLEIQPSIINDSGNGYHLYYLLDKSYPIEMVTELCWRLEQHLLFADACHNACRILRAPYTYNRKDRKNPKSTGFVKFDNTRYSIADFDFLPVPAVPRLEHMKRVISTLPHPAEVTQFEIVELVSRCKKDPKLIAKLTANSNDEYLNLYKTNDGKGRGNDGKDRTRSGRDFHCICQLIKEGFSPLEITSIFYHYPIGEKFNERVQQSGLKSGLKYLAHTIEKSIMALHDEEEKKRNPSVRIITHDRY